MRLFHNNQKISTFLYQKLLLFTIVWVISRKFSKEESIIKLKQFVEFFVFTNTFNLYLHHSISLI